MEISWRQHFANECVGYFYGIFTFSGWKTPIDELDNEDVLKFKPFRTMNGHDSNAISIRFKNAGQAARIARLKFQLKHFEEFTDVRSGMIFFKSGNLF